MNDYGCAGEHGSCPLCADEALPVRIVALREGSEAVGVTGDGQQLDVLLDLVPGAGVGDVVLVHAGVAIARVNGDG